MRLSHIIIAGIVSTGFAYLAGYGLAKYTDHEHKGYTPAQIPQVDQLVKPEPMKLVHPKTKRERAEIIARIWGVEVR